MLGWRDLGFQRWNSPDKGLLERPHDESPVSAEEGLDVHDDDLYDIDFSADIGPKCHAAHRETSGKAMDPVIVSEAVACASTRRKIAERHS